jgi:hypothetical protein
LKADENFSTLVTAHNSLNLPLMDIYQSERTLCTASVIH